MKLHVTIDSSDKRIDTELLAREIADVVNKFTGPCLRKTVFVIGVRPGYGWHHPNTCREGNDVEVLVEVLPARVQEDQT